MIEFYKDEANEWRWRIKAANGEIIGESSEGFTEKRACREVVELFEGLSNVQLLMDALNSLPISEL